MEMVYGGFIVASGAPQHITNKKIRPDGQGNVKCTDNYMMRKVSVTNLWPRPGRIRRRLGGET